MKISKFKSILITLGLICVGSLTGCAAGNAANLQGSAVLPAPSVTVNAAENSSTVETSGGSVNYAVYEQYGLSYDDQKGCYSYNGDVVRFFNDPIAGASFTNFFTGTVDIEAKRDENNNLIGIEECSKETYDNHTRKSSNLVASGMPSTIQSGTTQDYEDWLKDYEAFGITYNKSDNGWYYDGEKIQILVDNEKAVVYLTEEGGICLAVIRNENHEITEIKAVSQKDAQMLLQNNNPGATFDSTVEEY